MTELRGSMKLRISILVTSLLLAIGALVTVALSVVLYALDFSSIGKYVLAISVLLSLTVMSFCWIYLYLSGRTQSFSIGYPFVLNEISIDTQQNVEADKDISTPGGDEFPPKYDTLPALVSTELPSYNQFCVNSPVKTDESANIIIPNC
ncbi:hypothetical protein LOD99_10219 [Oopsacas minuta]|uniref:Uncharacterized protein n=1 Tax=Oopsacas minuta TaxID=111878 RepID=A0AAV7KH71_9METZ|nr:hypothetical protein LOD99_10219 [Oopsacas minuta]